MLDAGCPMPGWRQKRVTRPRGAGEQIVNVREGFGVCCGVARGKAVCLFERWQSSRVCIQCTVVPRTWYRS